MREKLNLDFSGSDRLTIRVARSREELEAAYSILYEAYLAEGYMSANEARLRISLYNALPTTTTIVALLNGKVVGTLSSVKDSPLGLPSDSCFDLSEIRQNYPRISEVSGLAIHKDYRGNHGRILLPLCKYIHLYEELYHGTDAFVIAVNPKHDSFYKHILLFQSVGDGLASSSFAGGAPALLKVQDLKTYRQRLKEAYAGHPPKSDLYSYFFKDEPEIIFPDRPYYRAFDTLMSPENLQYFFQKRTNLLNELSESERQVLRSYYLMPEYDELFRSFENIHYLDKRKAPRFAVQAKGQVRGPDMELLPIFITDISLDGLGGYSQHPIDHERVVFSLHLGPQTKLRVAATPVWNARKNHFGFQLTDAPSLWEKVIADFHNEYTGKIAAIEEQIRKRA